MPECDCLFSDLDIFHMNWQMMLACKIHLRWYKMRTKSHPRNCSTHFTYADDNVLSRSLKPLRSLLSRSPPNVQIKQKRYSLSICSSPPISMLSASIEDSRLRQVFSIPTSDIFNFSLKRNVNYVRDVYISFTLSLPVYDLLGTY